MSRIKLNKSWHFTGVKVSMHTSTCFFVPFISYLFQSFLMWRERERERERGVAIILVPSTSTTKSFLSTSKSVSRPVSFASASVPCPCCGSQTTVHVRKMSVQRVDWTRDTFTRANRVKDAEINSIYLISRQPVEQF